MPSYKPPIPTNASKKAVHDFAELAAKKLGYAPGAPIEDVVDRLGGEICYHDILENGVPDSIKVEDFGNFSIFLSSLTSPQRDRFTVAHELGHYLLHFPRVRKVEPESGMVATRWVDEAVDSLVRAEWEANWFAAGFLMPETEFLKKSRSGASLDEVASYFGVSKAAAEVRAKNLKA
jgi:Zn-dependent peptidase ImmA (M78 family)